MRQENDMGFLCAFTCARVERDQSSNRPTATDTLCPPNPKVLFNANRTVRSRAV